jgi:hypothetical protein
MRNKNQTLSPISSWTIIRFCRISSLTIFFLFNSLYVDLLCVCISYYIQQCNTRDHVVVHRRKREREREKKEKRGKSDCWIIAKDFTYDLLRGGFECCRHTHTQKEWICVQLKYLIQHVRNTKLGNPLLFISQYCGSQSADLISGLYSDTAVAVDVRFLMPWRHLIYDACKHHKNDDPRVDAVKPIICRTAAVVCRRSASALLPIRNDDGTERNQS